MISIIIIIIKEKKWSSVEVPQMVIRPTTKKKKNRTVESFTLALNQDSFLAAHGVFDFGPEPDVEFAHIWSL